MPVLPIVKEPHRVLRNKAREVPVGEISSSRIQELISDMKETLKNTTDGVGLAAPQIGEPLRLFIVSEEAKEIDRIGGEIRKTREKRTDWKYYVFINPKLKNSSRRKLEDSEGCLSIPGKYGVLERHEKITVEAYDEYGKKFTRGASKFFARVLQHELDHLDGKLFIDRADRVLDVEVRD